MVVTNYSTKYRRGKKKYDKANVQQICVCGVCDLLKKKKHFFFSCPNYEFHIIDTKILCLY